MSSFGRRVSNRFGETSLVFTLAQVRKLRDLTLREVARRLRTTSSTVSGYETARDPKLSSLRKSVEAMGGTLILVAAFPEADRTLTSYLLRPSDDPRTKVPTWLLTGRRAEDDCAADADRRVSP